MGKPNILMIMCDQFNRQWMGCAGHPIVKTPNLDRLASEGIRFANHVCNAPVCAPSRISLAGGVYPHHLGSLDNFSIYPVGMKKTYYEMLRERGYRIGVAGKTDLHKADHFCGADGNTPIMHQLGFTDPLDTEGKMHAMKTLDFRWNPTLPKGNDRIPIGPYQSYLMSCGRMDAFAEDYNDRNKNKPIWYANPSVLDTEYYQDCYIARNAVQFLETKTGEHPWHLFVSFVGPHDPWDAPREYYDIYQNEQFPVPPADDMEKKPAWLKKRQKMHSCNMTTEAYQEVMKNYAGMITLIDDKIGEILEALKKTGQYEDTMIVFCADHGEMMGAHGMFEKRVMYEDSVKVPLIISHPGYRKAATVSAPTEHVDLYPTILEYAGVDFSGETLDGKSLLPLIRGERATHKRYQFSEIVHGRMLTDGKYKIIENINDNNELYDLETDPEELHNIIDEEKKLAKDLLWKIKKVMAFHDFNGLEG